MRATAVLVIAKEPLPGKVKTRLSPPCSPEEAARIAEAALVETLQAVALAPASRRVVVLDGTPGPWLPPGFDVLPQRGEGLDERLAHAFEDVGGSALLVGMDTPQITATHLMRASNYLGRADCGAVLGHTEDGGYWIVGLSRPEPRAFIRIPMSTAVTGRIQEARLAQLGIRVARAETLRDVDTYDDALAVAAEKGEGRFRREVTRVARRLAGAAS